MDHDSIDESFDRENERIQIIDKKRTLEKSPTLKSFEAYL